MASGWVESAFNWLRKSLTSDGPAGDCDLEFRLRWLLLLTDLERRILLSFLDWQERGRGYDGSWENSFTQSRRAEDQALNRHQVENSREDALVKLGYVWSGIDQRAQKKYQEANEQFQSILQEIVGQYGAQADLDQRVKQLERELRDVRESEKVALDLAAQHEEREQSLRAAHSQVAATLEHGSKELLRHLADILRNRQALLLRLEPEVVVQLERIETRQRRLAARRQEIEQERTSYVSGCQAAKERIAAALAADDFAKVAQLAEAARAAEERYRANCKDETQLADDERDLGVRRQRHELEIRAIRQLLTTGDLNGLAGGLANLAQLVDDQFFAERDEVVLDSFVRQALHENAPEPPSDQSEASAGAGANGQAMDSCPTDPTQSSAPSCVQPSLN